MIELTSRSDNQRRKDPDLYTLHIAYLVADLSGLNTAPNLESN